MKDIYSPLEIDEEWDNFAAPTDAAVMEKPTTSIQVNGENPSPANELAQDTTTQADAIVKPEVHETPVTNVAVGDGNNIDEATATNDPAREAAMAAMSQPENDSEASATKQDSNNVDATISSWTAKDPIPNPSKEASVPNDVQSESNTLDINDMGPTADSEATKVNVGLGDSVANNQQEQPDIEASPEASKTDDDEVAAVKLEVPKVEEDAEDDAAEEQQQVDQAPPKHAVQWEEPEAGDDGAPKDSNTEPADPEKDSVMSGVDSEIAKLNNESNDIEEQLKNMDSQMSEMESNLAELKNEMENAKNRREEIAKKIDYLNGYKEIK